MQAHHEDEDLCLVVLPWLPGLLQSSTSTEDEDGGCRPVPPSSAALGTSLGDAELGSGADDTSVQIPTS